MLHIPPENNEFEGEIIPCSDFRLGPSQPWINVLQNFYASHSTKTSIETHGPSVLTPLEREARLSREAWVLSMDASDTARSEVRGLRTTVLAQQTEIAALLAVVALQGWQRPAGGPTQPEALINQGVADALAARDADRSTNGDDNHNLGTGVRRKAPPTRECTYPDFMKCKPLYFKGTKGVFELTQCALTWWNSHVKTVGHDVAYAMTWTNLKKKMTGKYCPRGEIKKLEAEMWNLKVKESEKIEKYVGGLPDMIYGSVMASKPKTMQDAIEFATELMDKKIHTFAERQRSGEKKPYGDPNLYAQNATITMTVRVLQNATSQKPTCYECGAQGHFKRDCPKLKNNNRGNQGGNGNAPAKVYAVGRAGKNPNSNVVTGTFLLNNRYASVLFDTGADRSFVSTSFRSQIDITLSTLDHYYDVELADGRIIGLNAIIRGCTLNFLNHPFY
ncbi:reverse transcriptase domain-containing protein [Tanacetum coccineum]